MKIDKEKFNKLKQLDRIEFRQKYDKIENIRADLGNFFLFSMVIFCIFLTGYLIAQQHTVLLDLARLFGKLAIVIFFIEIVGWVFCSIIRKKKFEELEQEYFQVEVKK